MNRLYDDVQGNTHINGIRSLPAMEDDLSAISDALERKGSRSDRSAKRQQERYLGHKTNRGFYVVILLLVIVILALVVAHFGIVKEQEEELRTAKLESAFLQSELDHYKEAYGIAVQDAQAFGRMYELGYRGESPSDAAQGAVARPAIATSDAAEPKRLPERSVWDYYHAQGIITDECVPTTKVVQTPGDTVEIVIVASGKRGEEWPSLNLLVDATTIATFTVDAEQEGVYKAIVELPKGTHRLDLVHLNGERSGALAIPVVRIGDRTLENEVSVLDYGEAFSLFDCEETDEGDTLKRSGAMRFRIEKV